MKLVATEFISLDGVYEAPGGETTLGERGGWTFPYNSPEFAQFKSDELAETDALLLGKNTYDGFAEAWPARTGDDFADKFNQIPKYIVTHSDTALEWQNAHKVEGEFVTSIRDIKAQPGGSLMVHGSGALVRQLLAENLVDEIRLMVFPVVVGRGKRLFPFEGPFQRFTLSAVQELPHGVEVRMLQPIKEEIA